MKKGCALTVGCSALAAACTLGCVDPEAAYNDFLARRAGAAGADAGLDAPADVVTTDAEGGGCRAPVAGELDGTFLFVVSIAASPKLPTVFKVDITTEAQSDGSLKVTDAAQPLSYTDRHTPVGSPVPPDTYVVNPDGTYVHHVPPGTIPGAANPVTKTDIEGALTLTGQVCSARTPDNPDSTIDFGCGTLVLALTKPTALTVNGTFTDQRITDPSKYPDAVINCNKDPADPPGP